MDAQAVFGSNINAQLTNINNPVRVIASHDLGRFGVFALVSSSFNHIKGRVSKRYTIEAYELDSEGICNMVDCRHYKNVSELKKAFKDYQLR